MQQNTWNRFIQFDFFSFFFFFDPSSLIKKILLTEKKKVIIMIVSFLCVAVKVCMCVKCKNGISF